MERSRATLALLAALGAFALLLAGGSSRAQVSAPNLPERYRARLLVVDSLAQLSRYDTALTALQPTLREARRRGDRRSLAFLVGTQASLQRRSGLDPRRAAREALQLALAVRDTTTLMAALGLLQGESIAHDGLEEPALEWLLRLALGRDDVRYEGIARTGLADVALQEGRFDDAHKGYSRAIELTRQSGDWRTELGALTGLGHVYYNLGDFDRSRQSHLKVARLAEERQSYSDQGHAYDDLGALEFVLGDPDAAVEYYRRSHDVFLRAGNPRDWIAPAVNIAIAQNHMGQYGDAESTLTQVITACDSLGLLDQEGLAFSQLASAQALEGKLAEAVGICRRGLALGRRLQAQHRAELTLTLTTALAEQDSAPAALALLDRGLRGMRGRVPRRQEVSLELSRGELLLKLGRAREALQVFQRTLPLSNQTAAWQRIRVLTFMGLCEQTLGRLDRAAARLEEAVAVWELDRGVPQDPEWREQRGSSGRTLHAVTADVMLAYPADTTEEKRQRLAYQVLQRFKARALRERILGPTLGLEAQAPSAVDEPVTVESLQGDVLREGEVLLDASLGSFGSFLFAVTRDELRVVRLPSDRELERRLEVHRERVSSPPEPGVDVAAADSAASDLGQFLLGGVADLIARGRRIIFSPDGALAELPLGALQLPGADGRLEALAATHEIEYAPSATLWAGLRRRSATDTGKVRVLALAGPDDERGTPLPGAVREARWLAARFEGVDLRLPERGGGAVVARDELSHYDVLHLAAHTRVDGQHPWYSGVLLEPPGAPDHDPYLRAGSIAALSLPARLVVLSGCESARGRMSAGEGVQGMSAAFLSAGVPAVVATLWRVEDRTTAHLMEAYYDALAGGATAAAALRSAQEVVRRVPRTRHPFYWAGFVLIGDGGVRAALKSKPQWLWPLAAAGGVVLGAAVLAMRRRRSRDSGSVSGVV
jgi:CHAT domain-containing protein/tetratricopeptide (TPR) repeat protein